MGIPDPVRDRQFYDGVIVRRILAFVIDFTIVLVVMFVFLVLIVAMTSITAGVAASAGAVLGFLTYFSTGFLYFWLLISERSATVGMMITGIEVRDANGNRLDRLMAFLHTAGFYVSTFFMPLLIIGWILMATSPKRQMLHDLVLGIVVINRPT